MHIYIYIEREREPDFKGRLSKEPDFKGAGVQEPSSGL